MTESRQKSDESADTPFINAHGGSIDMPSMSSDYLILLLLPTDNRSLNLNDSHTHCD